MLSLSQTTGYALLALSCLHQANGGWTRADEIARRTKIPRAYLSKIMHLLGRNGIVRSKRGYQGGFALSQSAKDVSVLDVAEAVEGALTRDCLLGLGACSDAHPCPLHEFWQREGARIESKLRRVRLPEMAGFVQKTGGRGAVKRGRRAAGRARSGAVRLRGWAVAAGLVAILLVNRATFADATGLNNIPTADTPPHRKLVFQFKSTIGDETDALFFGGVKSGLEIFGQRFEWGVDSTLGVGSLGDDAGPAILQFKLAADLSDQTALALGVANLGVRSQDRRDVGQPFDYAVLTHDFGPFRGHAGYSLQQDNNAAFFGFDKTVQLFDRDLTLRTDFIQIDDQDQWLGSAGFVYFVNDYFAFESWMSQPFESGEPTFVLKFDLAFDF